MEMNPNELKMYVALQPQIRAAIGEYIDSYTEVICTTGKRVHVYIDCDYACPNIIRGDCPHRIIFPQTIDPESPERGLWGMLKGRKALFEDETGSVSVRVASGEYEAETPTEAILLALCNQNGIKV